MEGFLKIMPAVYNEHGVITSPPEVVLSAKNRKGSLTLSFHNDNGAWMFGYSGGLYPRGKLSVGSHSFSGRASKNRDVSYNSFAAAKKAAFDFCKEHVDDKENRKVLIELLDEMNQRKLWEEI
jgi:hypothetical protein